MNRMASGLPRRMLPANLEADFLYKKISNYNKSEEEKQNIIGMITLINAINFDSSNPAEKLKSKNDIINFTKQPSFAGNYIKNSYPFGVTPLWLAIDKNYLEFIEPLLNAGANANITVDGKKLYDIASPEAKAILDTYKKRGGRYRRKSLKKRKSKKSKTKKRN